MVVSGDSLDLIPYPWGAAASLYGIGMVIIWLVFIAALVCLCVRDLFPVVRHFMLAGGKNLPLSSRA